VKFYRDALACRVFENPDSGEPSSCDATRSTKKEGPLGRRTVGGDGRAAVDGRSTAAISRFAAGHSPAIRTVHVESISTTPTAHSRGGYPPEQDPFEIGGVRMFFVKTRRNPGRIHRVAPGGVRATTRGTWCADADGTGPMSYSHADSSAGQVAIITAGPGRPAKHRRALLESGAASCWLTFSRRSWPRQPMNSSGRAASTNWSPICVNPESAQRLIAQRSTLWCGQPGWSNNAIATNEPKASVDHHD